MELNLAELDEEPKLRPTLLTVLCILTFIGSGWSILSNVWAYTSASKTSQIISKVAHSNENDSTKNNRSAAYDSGHRKGLLFRKKMMFSVSKMMTAGNIRNSAIGGIVSALFTLLGALLMWQLKRKGFYFYIAGILIGIAVPFYLYGDDLTAIGISFFAGFFGLVFIALYALNIKSMR